MLIKDVLWLISHLIAGIREAVDAGRDEVTDAHVDAGIAEMDAAHQGLLDAIRRARERENN